MAGVEDKRMLQWMLASAVCFHQPLTDSRAFMEYMKGHTLMFRTVKNIGKYLLCGFEEAHKAVISAAEQRGDDTPGTTTLLGGILIRTKRAGICIKLQMFNE